MLPTDSGLHAALGSIWEVFEWMPVHPPPAVTPCFLRPFVPSAFEACACHWRGTRSQTRSHMHPCVAQTGGDYAIILLLRPGNCAMAPGLHCGVTAHTSQGRDVGVTFVYFPALRAKTACVSFNLAQHTVYSFGLRE